MTLYEILLFFHIVAIATWVGGGIVLNVVGARAQATRDPQFRARFATTLGGVGPVIGGSALVALGTGIGMVLDSPVIEISQTWIWLALALFAVSAVVGGAYFGPASNKIVAALESGQVEEADRRARVFNTVSRLDLVTLLVIVWLMVAKPGFPGT